MLRGAVLFRDQTLYFLLDKTTFQSIAKQLAIEYYNDNTRDILYRSENSILEPFGAYDAGGTPIETADDTELRVAFENILAKSTAYVIMSRCGFDTADYFDENDFQNIIGFNTPDMVYALGTAVSDLSEQVLRDIEIVIRKYERTRAVLAVKNAERSNENHDRTHEGRPSPNLQSSRGLSASEHQAEQSSTDGDNRDNGQIRENEESVSERTSDNTHHDS